MGIVQTVNACVIPEIVGQFNKAYPGIRMECSELAVGEIEAGLEFGHLDMGIGFLPPSRETLHRETLFTEELVAVVSDTHALAQRREIRVRELANHPLVLLSAK